MRHCLVDNYLNWTYNIVGSDYFGTGWTAKHPKDKISAPVFFGLDGRPCEVVRTTYQNHLSAPNESFENKMLTLIMISI